MRYGEQVTIKLTDVDRADLEWLSAFREPDPPEQYCSISGIYSTGWDADAANFYSFGRVLRPLLPEGLWTWEPGSGEGEITLTAIETTVPFPDMSDNIPKGTYAAHVAAGSLLEWVAGHIEAPEPRFELRYHSAGERGKGTPPTVYIRQTGKFEVYAYNEVLLRQILAGIPDGTAYFYPGTAISRKHYILQALRVSSDTRLACLAPIYIADLHKLFQ